jgi:hypothetical protein
MCGFGPVNLLPGIGGGFTVNTAISLPVGVEAYAALAIGAWMAPGTPGRARRFARWSALGALAYGMAGQVAYHLLAAAHVGAAPWPIVVLVSCMPVIVLGFAAALTHLLRSPQNVAGERSLPGVSSRSPATPPASVPAPVPGLREIQREYRCGMPVAKKIRRAIRAHAAGPPAGVVPLARAGASGQGAGPPPDGVLAAFNGHGGAGG